MTKQCKKQIQKQIDSFDCACASVITHRGLPAKRRKLACSYNVLTPSGPEQSSHAR